MASGSFYKNITSHPYRLLVEWTSTPNTTANTSTVKALVKLVCPYALSIGARSGNTVSINGVNYSYNSSAISTSGGTYTLATINSDAIQHNSDGSKSITITAKFKLNATIGSTYYSTVSASATINLDDIPRASTITVTESVKVGDRVVISIRKSVSSYTHTLQYKFESETDYKNIITNYSGSSEYFTIPKDEAYAKMGRKNTYVVVNFKCITLNNGAVVGESFYSIRAHAIAEECKPTAVINYTTPTGVGNSYSGNNNTFISGISGGTITCTVNAFKGAGVKSIYTYVNGEKEYLFTSSTATQTTVTRTSSEYFNVDQDSFIVYVEDSRGFIGESEPYPIICIRYIPPTIEITATPPDYETGLAKMDVKGVFFNGSFGALVNEIKSIRYRYREVGGTWNTVSYANDYTVSGNTYKAVIQLPLTYQKEYEVDVWFTDSHQTRTEIYRFKTYIPFDWSYEDFQFNVPVVFGAGIKGSNKVLWSGASHMNGSQTISLSDSVSAQNNGIVLVFSYYDGSNALNHSFTTHYIPKYQIAAFPNCGHTFLMAINAGFSNVGAKYLTFTDNSITGHSGNTTSGSNSGISFNNSNYVLRYVIGV